MNDLKPEIDPNSKIENDLKILKPKFTSIKINQPKRIWSTLFEGLSKVFNYTSKEHGLSMVISLEQVNTK